MENKDKLDEKEVGAFIKDIEAVNTKHGLKLVPVIQYGTHAIQATFNIIKNVETKPEADTESDSGDTPAKK